MILIIWLISRRKPIIMNKDKLKLIIIVYKQVKVKVKYLIMI